MGLIVNGKLFESLMFEKFDKQADFAEALGVHISNPSTWKKGAGITSSMAVQLASFLEVDPDRLFHYRPKNGKGPMMSPRQFLNQVHERTGLDLSPLGSLGGNNSAMPNNPPKKRAKTRLERLVKGIDASKSKLTSGDVETIAKHIRDAREDTLLAMASQRRMSRSPLLDLYDTLGVAEEILFKKVKPLSK